MWTTADKDGRPVEVVTRPAQLPGRCHTPIASLVLREMDHKPMANPAEADPRFADAWRDHRQRLMDVAYRMLGSVSDAEDDVRGWLVTVTSRLCLDQLRSAASRRTSYVGPWLPEPVVDLPSLGANPADRVTLDDS